MESAAKKKNSLAMGVVASMIVWASALLFSSAANASSASHVGQKSRAEVSGPFTAKSIEHLAASPVNATRYYDALEEDALECTVAPSRTVVTRPSARQSELDVSGLNPGHRPQVSFSNGREVSYGSRGSVRPDNYRVGGEALEVKNYDLSQAGNRANLYNTIHEQYLQRISNLPRGTQQRIVIDIRGQNVSEGVLMRVRSNILTITRTPNVTVEFLR